MIVFFKLKLNDEAIKKSEKNFGIFWEKLLGRIFSFFLFFSKVIRVLRYWDEDWIGIRISYIKWTKIRIRTWKNKNHDLRYCRIQENGHTHRLVPNNRIRLKRSKKIKTKSKSVKNGQTDKQTKKTSPKQEMRLKTIRKVEGIIKTHD